MIQAQRPPASDPIDLTQPMGSGMPAYPADPPVEIVAYRSHDTDGYAATQLRLGTHSGTHVDAPSHFLVDGATIDSYPPARFFGAGVVLDLRAGPRELDEATMRAAATAAGGLETGDFAVLWTGWDTHFGDDFMVEHPFLTPDAAQVLLETGVSLVATDALNVDSSEGGEFPVHPLLLGADVLIVENLRGLAALGSGRAFFAFVPLRLKGLDGSPIRALSWKV